METYHKIQTLFKREQSGPNKGKMIHGEWTTPELAYLADNEWEFTEKVDGTNIRVELQYDSGQHHLTVNYGGRTDNAVIPTPLLEHLEEVFPTYPHWRRDLTRPSFGERWNELRIWMRDNSLEKVILFGEGYGPKIQGGGRYVQGAIEMNRHLRGKGNDTRVPEHKFVLFDVKIGDLWLTRDNVNDIAEKLGIESVPVIGTGTLHHAIGMVANDKAWDRYGVIMPPKPLMSKWGNFEAEGIVARPVVPLFNRKGERIITKIKAVDFK